MKSANLLGHVTFIWSMKTEKRTHCFTLMETMVAATILAFAVVSAMSILSGARSTLMRAEARWTRQHLLAQAAEVFLLGGPTAEIPEGVLPEGYSATCEVYAAEENVPEEALEAIRGWRLAEYHISVLDSSGVLVAETNLRKVLKEEDLE